jgi:hypothetical protein
VNGVSHFKLTKLTHFYKKSVGWMGVMVQFKEHIIVVLLLGLISFTILSEAIQVSEAKKEQMSTQIRKTLNDDTAGHSYGWDPDGSRADFVISDSDAGVTSSTSDSVFISLMTRNNFQGICMVADTQETFFEIRCSGGPNDGSELHYVITTLPPHVVVSPLSSSSFDLPQGHGSRSSISPSMP